MYNKFVKYLYFPITEKIKGSKLYPYYKILDRTQWLTSKEIQSQQWNKLVKLLNEAKAHVPYYKFLSDTTINTYKDFGHLPILEKEDIRNNFDNLINQSFAKKYFKSRTSGSTGLSLEFFVSWEAESWVTAGQWRARGWFGIDIGDRGLYIWGRPLESKKDEILAKIKARIKNNLLISAFDLSDDTLEKNWTIIEKFKPVYIYGYASSIFQLANFVKKTNKKLSFSLKAVFTTAETIFDYQRQTIKEAFHCPVAQEYGAAETGAFGYECPHEHMHLFSENVFVEILNDDNQSVAPTETGKIVITPLHNYCMPLIRYNLGDVGGLVDDACPCKRNSPLLNLKIAKKTDIIITPEGKKFSSELFDYINLELIKNNIKGIKQFRVIQKSRGAFHLEIVKEESYSKTTLELFENQMRKFFGQTVDIKTIFVNDIEREQTGKLRYFISDINEEKGVK